MRTHLTLKLASVAIVSLATLSAAPPLSQAQEPTIPPVPTVDPNVFASYQPPHHWFGWASSYDGIPRTFSYQYSTRLNQPRKFRVIGQDGKTYWVTTVRGLPRGMQWLAP